MDKKYALVILCDDGYLKYAYAMLKTFVKYNKWFNGDVVVLCDDETMRFGETSLNNLKSLYDKVYKRKINVSRYEKIKDVFRNRALKEAYLNCFYKFECFEMSDYDRVVFCDCDVLFNDSIEILFTDDRFIVTKDCIGEKFDETKEFDGSSISAGVFAISKKDMNFLQDIIDFGINYVTDNQDFGRFPEQELMTEYFKTTKNKPIFYPKAYNCCNFLGSEPLNSLSEIDKLCEGGVKIVHLFGKPTSEIGEDEDYLVSNYFFKTISEIKYPKRLLILGLSCNKEPYLTEEKIAKNTWAKDIIEGKYENIDFYFFRSGTENKFFEKEHLITVTEDDGYGNTANKMKKSIELANSKIKYDYLVITNTATVLNIELINDFINSEFVDEEKYYGGALVWRISQVPFFNGRFIMLSRKDVDCMFSYDLKNILLCKANDYFIFNTLVIRDDLYGIFWDKLCQIKGIYDYEEFSIKDIGSNFFINCKEEKNGVRENHKTIRNIVGSYSLMKSDKTKYNVRDLIGPIKYIVNNNGKFKLEKLYDEKKK